MNYAIPVLVCHQNEDFRSYLREMLSKHGFFHVIEAATLTEVDSYMASEKKFFAILQSELASSEVLLKLKKGTNGYIFIAQPGEKKTLDLAVKMGVSHVVSFPFPSQHLVEKISRISDTLSRAGY
jgi:DNA-binding NtrC family response regulator